MAATWKYVVFALALLLAQGSADASERLTRRFLPEAHVQALAQDDAGFLWLGTSSGVVRYDGREMRRVFPETSASSSVRP